MKEKTQSAGLKLYWSPTQLGITFWASLGITSTKLVNILRSDAEVMLSFCLELSLFLPVFHEFKIGFSKKGGKSTFFLRFEWFSRFHCVHQNQHFSAVFHRFLGGFSSTNSSTNSKVLTIGHQIEALKKRKNDLLEVEKPEKILKSALFFCLRRQFRFCMPISGAYCAAGDFLRFILVVLL